MSSRNPAVVACTAVLVLLIASHFHREVQVFRGTSIAPVPVPGDFGVYYVAGVVASGHSKQALYCPPTPGHDPAQEMLMGTLTCPDLTRVAQSRGLPGTMRYIYPPFFAWFISPLSRLKPRAAYFAWRELSFVMLLGCVFVIVRWFRLNSFPAAFVLCAVGAISFFPVVETFYLGQVDIFIFTLWVLGLQAVRSRTPELSAICFAFGTAVKLTPAIAVPLFLIRRQWKWLIAYAITLMLLLACSVWRLGWENHEVFLSKVLPSISGGTPVMQSKSLGTLLHFIYLEHIPMHPSEPWGTTVALTRVKQLVSVGLCLAVLVVFWKRTKTADYLLNELVILSLVGLLAAPVTWRHHYVLALLPLLYLWIVSLGSTEPRLRNMSLLLIATLGMGTPIPDYLASIVHSNILQIILASVFTAAAVLTLVLLIQDYSVVRLDREAGTRSLRPVSTAEAA